MPPRPIHHSRIKLVFLTGAAVLGTLSACLAFARKDTAAVHTYGHIRISEFADTVIFDTGVIQITSSKLTGLAKFAWKGSPRLQDVYSSVRSGELVKSTGYSKHTFAASDITHLNDGFGKGIKVTLLNVTAGEPALRQNYYLYEDKPYFFAESALESTTPVSTNWIAPIVVDGSGAVDIGGHEDDHVLFVPWDNDHFIRYQSNSINSSGTSYEATAIYDNSSRKGLVLGSVTHDTWKTGIDYSGSNNKLDRLSIYGGASSKVTQDTMPHGQVSGTAVVSPRIFVGYYDDWRTGMEDFGAANRVIAPRLAWNRPMPVGWNSWAAYRCNINNEIMTGVSDFIKNDLQNNGFNNEGSVYVNWDAACGGGAAPAYDTVAAHIKANGQHPGIYFVPFARFGRGTNDDTPVPGTAGKYKWNDILLRDADGNPIATDGGRAIDTTHPGTKMYVQSKIRQFREWGYEYIKIDFLSHAAIEGKHYIPTMTAMQAYNYGMQYLREAIGDSMFVSLSIAPLFPGAEYAHSRRISCDAFGTIKDTEYMLNSVTYGWWLGKYYRYNDGDHIVVGSNSYAEARSRLASSAITGLFIDSDKFADSSIAQQRAKDLLARPKIMSLVRAGRTFHPVEGNTGDKATDLFALEDGGTYYLAAFNYEPEARAKTIDLARAGLDKGTKYSAADLWTGATSSATSTLTINLDASDATILRFTK